VNLLDLRVLLTRWYATAVGLALTLVLCVAAFTLFPMHYEAKAGVLFLPPVKAVGAGGNPYLDLGGLEGFADVAKLAILDPASAKQLKDAGADGQYVVEPDVTSAGPVLIVTGNATSNEAALTTLRLVLDRFPPIVKQVQDAEHVAPSSQITTKVITRDQQAKALTRGPIRTLIVALVAGLGLTFLGTSMLDGFLNRRTSRRTGTTGTAGPAAAPPVPGPPAPAPLITHAPPTTAAREPVPSRAGMVA